MSSNTNLEKIHQMCRICLKKGDVNIWNCKVSFQQAEINQDNFCRDAFIEKSFAEIMYIFFNSQDLLNFTDEFPLLCLQCLEDLKFCCIIYEKIKLANIQLKDLYQQSLNECIEEEHLIEVADENEISDINLFEILEEESVANLTQCEFDNVHELTNLSKSINSKRITPDKNDSFIVTQFIPEPLERTERHISNPTTDNDELSQPTQHLLTVNLKAVEVKDLKNLDSLESSQPLSADIIEPAIYICRYCPRAFAKADYLKTHIQKSHVCRLCTQPFSVTEDLFRHIREVHTENKCAICHKILSSRTNLRHHIKRVHRIKLPAKVTLIDFIKSTSLEENKLDNEVDILEELGAAEIHINTQYVRNYDTCTEIFNENIDTVINKKV